MKTFRALTVWQGAHTLALAVYKASATFPVEGHKRRRNRAFLNFLNIADSSLEELKDCFLLAGDLTYLLQSVVDRLFQEAELVGRMLSRFKAYIRQGTRDLQNPTPLVANA